MFGVRESSVMNKWEFAILLDFGSFSIFGLVFT